MYESIHNFMAKREWGEVEQELDIRGITWIELFVVFDTAEARTPGGKHVKDLDIEARPKERSNGGAKVKKVGTNKAFTSSNVLPSLQEEMCTFNAIVRDIARHELQRQVGKGFNAERRQHITCLANLGMLGHQGAIAGHCKVSDSTGEGSPKQY